MVDVAADRPRSPVAADRPRSRVAADRLRSLVAGLLTARGVPAADAATVAELLVEADLRGVDSHGVHLVAMYVERLAGGHLRPVTSITVCADHGATVHLDGGMGFGQLAGLEAARLAVERSGEHGVATIAVRETTHLGALAAYTQRVAAQGRIALLVQNGPTVVPPFGGITPLFSTNPLSYAVPAATEPTIVYDIATTAVAGNKILLAKKRGDATIPEGWANDERGRPTTDTAAASVFNLQWFGGHKGFGLGLLVELLGGLMAGSSYGTTEHTDSELVGRQRLAKGFTLIAIDPGRFLPLDEFRRRVDELITEIRGSERAEGVDRIWLPGEMEHHRRIERTENGIPLADELVVELDRLGAEAGLPALAGN